MEILDNGLRQPLDQGKAARNEPLAVKSRAHWLTVQCLDKPGSLAEIARVIAQHDQNIKVSNIDIKLMLPSEPNYLLHAQFCCSPCAFHSWHVSLACLLGMGALLVVTSCCCISH